MKTTDRAPHRHARGRGDFGVDAGEHQRAPDHDAAPTMTIAEMTSRHELRVVDRDDLAGEQPELVRGPPLVEGEEQDAEAEPERHQHRR